MRRIAQFHLILSFSGECEQDGKDVHQVRDDFLRDAVVGDVQEADCRDSMAELREEVCPACWGRGEGEVDDRDTGKAGGHVVYST